ncbi:sarcosine oxidase gamma subunit [Hamadaea flava]|uniref:Uncharacterized protein n=1 Tax=Hamadaea flava TaxID=1742688 RepID=A0ABV8LXU2_9ACTN|nr:hypothetical protein [Hamadaea flava]MCP2329211.1 sarcosine oxidase gamma subunit [Hamadaea flava]
MHGTPGNWYAIVEELAGGGNSAAWRPTKTRALGPDRAVALEVAAETAATHRPVHPGQEQGRQVFRQGEDTWIVVVDGGSGAYHFRVTLAVLEAVS